MLEHSTTDPAYADLAGFTAWRAHAAAAAARRASPKPITHRRLARPAGRVNPNPYALYPVAAPRT